MRRRNQKIGIVSYSSRKEEETLINKKRSSSNHKWEGRASAKKGAWRSFILPPQPASRLEKRNDKAKPELERSGQTRIGFTAWGLRESEKRNQAIGNSRESNVRESSETADSEYPSLVFTQIITRSQIAHIGVCFWGLPFSSQFQLPPSRQSSSREHFPARVPDQTGSWNFFSPTADRFQHSSEG